ERVGCHAVEVDGLDARQRHGERRVDGAVVFPEGVRIVRFLVEGDELDQGRARPSLWLSQRRSSFAKLSSSRVLSRMTCTVAPRPIRSPSSLTAVQLTWTRLPSWRSSTPVTSTRMPGSADAR